MAEFKEIMKQRERMCKSYFGHCSTCPTNSLLNGKKLNCIEFLTQDPERAEEIIMAWAEEHPIVTNAQKFEEVFGFGFAISNSGCVGFNCHNVKSCEECEHHNFWSKVYEAPKGAENDSSTTY